MKTEEHLRCSDGLLFSSKIPIEVRACLEKSSRASSHILPQSRKNHIGKAFYGIRTGTCEVLSNHSIIKTAKRRKEDELNAKSAFAIADTFFNSRKRSYSKAIIRIKVDALYLYVRTGRPPRSLWTLHAYVILRKEGRI